METMWQQDLSRKQDGQRWAQFRGIALYVARLTGGLGRDDPLPRIKSSQRSDSSDEGTAAAPRHNPLLRDDSPMASSGPLSDGLTSRPVASGSVHGVLVVELLLPSHRSALEATLVRSPRPAS
ncbi:uncharacterized protein PV09_05495 [Verruconis gallopava]|uniref:Uncharacterized protein n=1 Tax=Verruconis gallopava TaxID=253628 RepID=A0A0D2A9J9_9PEZI|nr:uncharacterized protein PV09_05495 [Verruconis gallopava]KIW03280.1 hypothetical protein PV09_05495 [Verruconis gallopava]